MRHYCSHSRETIVFLLFTYLFLINFGLIAYFILLLLMIQASGSDSVPWFTFLFPSSLETSETGFHVGISLEKFRIKDIPFLYSSIYAMRATRENVWNNVNYN